MPNIDEVLAKPMNTLEHLITSAKDVDSKWHELFELKEKFLACAGNFLHNTRNEVSNVFDKIPENKKHVYNVILMISANSLRMTDAVLSLAQVGHPDAALAITRTLFETCIDAILIKLDLTGHRARQYVKYDWIDMQQRLIATGDQIASQGQNRRSSHWTKIPNEPRLKYMHEKLDHIKPRFILDESDIDFLKDTWAVLNKWAHMSPVASGHLLCTHGSRNYGRLTHVVGKSCTGLNVPITNSGHILRLTMETYLDFSGKLTGNSYKKDIDLLSDICRKMDRFELPDYQVKFL